ncbi:carbohydrate porin [Phenylobacterium sp.]|uniref:carbohydrate porin n=1 Tax=Phenylobacterium sp. TaxID=1871053 RepID=UPI0027157D22|nr:carbohydrate porin [Phenylobacterium sp.]MDO8800619.1 carbohydrate porin [Phenylobacterium sp.]
MPRTAAGAYLLREQPLSGGVGDLRAIAGFQRLGVSGGVQDRVAPRLMLQPSVQYVVHPGGTRDAGPVVVLALRVSMDL